MALHIRDPEVDQLAARLARRKRVTKTQAVKDALRSELDRVEKRSGSLWERLQPLLKEIQNWPDTGVVIDKAFFDEINGEDER